MSLFGTERRAEFRYEAGAFAAHFSIDDLRAEIPLRQFTASMYGKTFNAPRLECWFGKEPYGFGGRVVEPSAMGALLASLKERVEAAVGQPFDSCFANYYRDGNDCIDWHADDEKWIEPWIASVSFGSARKFVLKNNATKETVEYQLGNGDMLVMGPGTQQAWKHSVPRTKKLVGPRLNLTFRQTVKS